MITFFSGSLRIELCFSVAHPVPLGNRSIVKLFKQNKQLSRIITCQVILKEVLETIKLDNHCLSAVPDLDIYRNKSCAPIK